ncbi:MAG: hypothetical protein JSR45_07915 [Proteobacteria bacterium]|nr:hypothetical protein [Pseudomonadota bacterium]
MRFHGHWAATAALILLCGCAEPHNDVLIFGTTTKIGLSVSAAPSSAATPQLSIGYNRDEAVWMPLIANGRGLRDGWVPSLCGLAQAQPCPAPLDQLKYKGVDGAQGSDAYSVFASLGTNLSGKGGDVSATFGTAQFFATGIAAQEIAKNPAVMQSVSVQAPAAAQSGALAAAVSKPGVSPGVATALLNSARDSADPELAGAYSKALIERQNNTAKGAQLAACAVLKAPQSPVDLLASKDESTDFVKDFRKAKDAAGYTNVVRAYPDRAADIASILSACGASK